ncbi:MAG: SGNH/GDSL hydrolase family protein [Candidatus Acidiferrales bacterium]
MELGNLGSRFASLFFRIRAGRVLGLGLFLTGLLTYRSFNRAVFGFWSYGFFLFILAVSALWLAELASSLRMLRLSNADFGSGGCAVAKLLDLAILTWGAAFFLDARDTPDKALRFAELVFFGSILPAAALLEWITLVFLFLALVIFMVPRLKGKWAQGGLAVGTILVLALVGEGICRVKVAVSPQLEPFPTNSQALWKRRYVKLNREGWRDADHAISGEAGTRRLLVVGDSFAYGLGIAHIEDRLGELLAKKLVTMTDERWEPINVSFGGGNTLDEIELLNRAVIYKPDVVLLIYVFNDMNYLLPATPEDETIFKPGGKFHPVMILFRNSFLFQELYLYYHIVYWRLTGADFGKEYEDAQLLSRHLQDVARFVSIARQAGANVWVIPFSIRIVHSPQWLHRYRTFVDQARAHSIPVCSLEKSFDGFTYRQLNINMFDGHPNERANLLATKAVAECLGTELRR